MPTHPRSAILPNLLHILIWLALITLGTTLLFSLQKRPIQRPYFTPSETPELPGLPRTSLQKALAGDLSAIAALMAQWERIGMVRIAGNTPRSILLKRNLDYLRRLLCPILLGEHRAPLPQLIPQSYLSATLLLAIAQTNQLIALPRGMRYQKQLFPEAATAAVDADLPALPTESWLKRFCGAAFVAPYSHPAWRAKLPQLGIPLCQLSTPRCLSELQTSLQQAALLAGHPGKGELLATFVETALLAIDQILADHATLKMPMRPQKLLYVNYYAHFSLPPADGMIRELLARLELHSHCSITGSTQSDIPSPLTFEKLQSFKADVLIVAADSGTLSQPQASKELLDREIFNSQQQIAFVDAEIQHSSSQYLALAYYDLAAALLQVAKR